MDEDSPVDSPLVIDASSFGRTNSLIRAIGVICRRLECAGFFGLPEMRLIVPTGILPDDVGGHIDVFESDVCGNDAFLFTTQDRMTWLDWFCAVSRGEKPGFVNTMPWAHAKFINWKKEKIE